MKSIQYTFVLLPEHTYVARKKYSPRIVMESSSSNANALAETPMIVDEPATTTTTAIADVDLEAELEDDNIFQSEENTAPIDFPPKRSNYKMLRYLRLNIRRKTPANEAKVDTVMMLKGTWATECQQLWTYHDEPIGHRYIYNPARVVARGNLTFPSALWLMNDDEARAAGLLVPPPPMEDLWDNYRRHVELNMLYSAAPLCTRCSERCWRTTPNVELPDLTNRPFVEAWARLAKRDPRRLLDFFVRMAASGLTERCGCEECDRDAESTLASLDQRPSERRQRAEPLPTSSFVAILDDEERYIAPAVTADEYDFVAAYPDRDDVVLRRRAEEIRAWHTGHLGCLLRWLLEEHLDTEENADHIDLTFERLYGLGCTSLALPLGMYATRTGVLRALDAFRRRHRAAAAAAAATSVSSDTSIDCCDVEGCTCLRGSTSPNSRVAAHMLAIARNVPWSAPSCDTLKLGNNDVFARTAMTVSDAEVMGDIRLYYDNVDAEEEDAEPISPPRRKLESLMVTSWRQLFATQGANASRSLLRRVALPEVCESLARVFSRRVLLLCNRLFVHTYLQEEESVFGGRVFLLGHVNPCQPRRPIGNARRRRIPRGHGLPDLTLSEYFMNNMSWP